MNSPKMAMAREQQEAIANFSVILDQMALEEPKNYKSLVELMLRSNGLDRVEIQDEELRKSLESFRVILPSAKHINVGFIAEAIIIDSATAKKLSNPHLTIKYGEFGMPVY